MISADAPPRPWTRDEQKLLEQALKTYTAASNPKDRWEKIAGAIKGRSKRDCVIRYKVSCKIVVLFEYNNSVLLL